MSRAINEKVKEAEELYKSGMSLSDIAKKLELPEGTVRSWKNRGKWSCNATQRKCNVAKESRTAPKPMESSLAMSLTEKERLFCEIYVRNFNATQAAIKAGYSYDSAYAIGYENLRKPHIRNYIGALKEAKKAAIMLDTDDLVELQMRIAFADITDFLEFGRVLIPVMGAFGPIVRKNERTGEEEPLLREVNDVRFRESFEVDGGLISQVKMGKDGASIKLEDRQKALDWLAKFFESFPSDKHKREYDNAKLALEERSVRAQEAKLKDNGDNPDEENSDNFIEALEGKIDEVWQE